MNQDTVRGSVLVLDDEKNIVIVLCAILEKVGLQVEGFVEPTRALARLRSKEFDAVVTDLFMPEMDGLEFLREAKKLYPSLPVVMITAFGTVDTAVDAIKNGAFDYVTKPFEQSEILTVLKKAVVTKRLSALEVIPGGLDGDLTSSEQFLAPLLKGESPELLDLQELISTVAATPSSVLITGEPGTGKELLVEDIHRSSHRALNCLMRVNCAALPADSLSSELFGSEKKPGRLELANKGTLFLDEVSEMDMPTQIRFLEFLESGELEKAQFGERLKLDVRIVAATYKNLEMLVQTGKFREDLYYRLNVVPIHLPPLRDRKPDFSGIVKYFIDRLNSRLGKSIQSVDDACLVELSEFQWPGNFRQLENVLERMMLLAKDDAILTAQQIPKNLKDVVSEEVRMTEPNQFRDIVRRKTQSLEKELIEKALGDMGENVTKTAEFLGLSRKGLQLKMKSLGIR